MHSATQVQTWKDPIVQTHRSDDNDQYLTKKTYCLQTWAPWAAFLSQMTKTHAHPRYWRESHVCGSMPHIQAPPFNKNGHSNIFQSQHTRQMPRRSVRIGWMPPRRVCPSACSNTNQGQTQRTPLTWWKKRAMQTTASRANQLWRQQRWNPDGHGKPCPVKTHARLGQKLSDYRLKVTG